MPLYTYVVIAADGTEAETFEIEQSVAAAPLAVHPISGRPVRRVFSAPNLVTRYSDAAIKSKTTDKAYLESKGFTRYEKDKSSGTYHKTADSDPAAPDVIDPKAH